MAPEADGDMRTNGKDQESLKQKSLPDCPNVDHLNITISQNVFPDKAMLKGFFPDRWMYLK
jgi:hypothetical protein